jgi:hypothetical protein
MKKIILSEKAFDTVKRQIINESYADKIIMVKNFLDKNFTQGTLEDQKNNGTIGPLAVFVKLNNGLPTKNSVWIDDVVDQLESEENYHKLVANELERKGLFLQIAKDWYNRSPKLKLGNLTSYDFLRNVKGS